MRKIIGFKLPARVKELQRRARKAGLRVCESRVDEAPLGRLLERAVKASTPSVLFETFSHPDPEQALLSSMPGLAYSLVLVTLGSGFDAFREQTAREDPSTACLWPLIQDVLLDEATRFATALLEDEAARESCELSPFTTLSGAAALGAALKKLEFAKIGVALSEDGGLLPGASAAVSLSWLSKSKSKGKSKS